MSDPWIPAEERNNMTLSELARDDPRLVSKYEANKIMLLSHAEEADRRIRERDYLLIDMEAALRGFMPDDKRFAENENEMRAHFALESYKRLREGTR